MRRAIGHLVEGGQAGGVDGVVLQCGDSRGVVEHQIGDAVQQRGGAPPFRVAGQHDSLRGAVEGGDDERPRRRAGPVELTLVERLGRRGHALRQQHVLPENMPRHSAYGLANFMIAWRSSTPRVTDSTRSAPLGLAVAKALSLPLVRIDLRGDVLPRDRGAVAPHRFRVDGPRDDLRVGAGQLGAGEVVGVQRHRAVGGDPERPRHAGLQHARGVGVVAVDMQRVEVLRERGQRQPQIAALLQGGDVLRVDVVRVPS